MPVSAGFTARGRMEGIGWHAH